MTGNHENRRFESGREPERCQRQIKRGRSECSGLRETSLLRQA